MRPKKQGVQDADYVYLEIFTGKELMSEPTYTNTKTFSRNIIEHVRRSKPISSSSMTSRARLQAALEHKPVDRLCVDFGAGGQTGIGICAVDRLRRTLLGASDYHVKVIEPYQMLGEIDQELRQALKLDVVGISPRLNMFGYANENWKAFTMPVDKTEIMVPGQFNFTVAENGDILMYPEGDVSVPPCAKMPRMGYFFDSIPRKEHIEDSKLNPMYNCEEFGVLSDEDIEYYAREVSHYYEKTEYGIYLTIPNLAFGDISLVPAPWLKYPKGIRDVEEWYISTATRRDYIYKIFEQQCEIGLKNIEKLAKALGDMVQVVFVSGTDFGTQRGPFISLQSYRDLHKPFQKIINDKIHELTNWKIFIHSCGSVYQFIPDFIEAGFDILNPVQCSAAEMDPRRIKKEFGNQLVLWGGGVDTQKTLPFGTPEEVYDEVRRRIEIFSENSGFIFNSIHNIQSNISTENILAMFRAINDMQMKQ